MLDYYDKNWAKDCWVIDCDADWPMLFLNTESKEAALASIKEYFGNYVGSAVTDLMINPFEQNSSVPTKSKHISWFYEKSTWTEENGIPVDYSRFSGIYKVFTEYGIDIFAEIFKTVKDFNIRPWLTLRMNDAHCNSDETAYMRSDLYYEAKRDGMMIGDRYGYFAHNFNFSYEKIRTVMLEYIEEIFLRYDVFGYQLDFIREIFCFDYVNETGICDIMTDFIREVKKIVKKAEEKFGHPMKLSVRFGRSIEHNKVFGFDAETWVKEGLVDVIVPSPRWECTDSAIPVDEWKTLAGENVAVFAGVETRMTYASTVSADHVKGYAAGFYAKGADGVYFDNFYQSVSNGLKVWNLKRKDLTEGLRKFVVTSQDIVPEGHTGYKPLPLNVDSDGAELNICMGIIRNSEKVTLTVSVKNGYKNLPSVKLNGVGNSDVRLIETPIGKDMYKNNIPIPLMKDSQFVEYTFNGVSAECDLTIRFENGVVEVNYIELSVEP